MRPACPAPMTRSAGRRRQRESGFGYRLSDAPFHVEGFSMKSFLAVLFAVAIPAAAQASSPWDGLDFLKGSWSASAKGQGGAAVTGSYSFQSELDRHIMARYSTR